MTYFPDLGPLTCASGMSSARFARSAGSASATTFHASPRSLPSSSQRLFLLLIEPWEPGVFHGRP